MQDSWITCTRPNPVARLRLFCVPYAGGAASAFYGWPDGLPAFVETCPVQLPGRENRLGESPFERMAPLVEALGGAIRARLDLPFALFGHSMGAFVCFELARWLRRRGANGPVHLFVSGCRAPQLPDLDPAIHHLPDAEFIRELRRFGGTPEAVLQHEELMQLFLPILRADLAVHETHEYVQDEPLDCSISAFAGAEDEGVSPEAVDAWREQTRAGFCLRTFPGNHFFLQSARGSLLQAIFQDLVQVLSGLGGAGF